MSGQSAEKSEAVGRGFLGRLADQRAVFRPQIDTEVCIVFITSYFYLKIYFFIELFHILNYSALVARQQVPDTCKLFARLGAFFSLLQQF